MIRNKTLWHQLNQMEMTMKIQATILNDILKELRENVKNDN